MPDNFIEWKPHLNNRRKHEIKINARIIKLLDIKEVKTYIKELIKLLDYQCLVLNKDTNKEIKEINQKVNEEKRETLKKMGNAFGSWRYL